MTVRRTDCFNRRPRLYLDRVPGLCPADGTGGQPAGMGDAT
jgi:hypothetical protein